MTKREAFLQAVSKEYVEEFLNFVKLSKDRSDPFDLDELLQEFPKKQKEELWENLGKLLTDVLLEFPMEKWNCEIDEDSADEMEVEGSADLKQTMSVIEGVIMVACASIRVIDEDVTYGALLECAIILNGILDALPKSQLFLQISIQRLCESWWEKGLEGKEELGKTAFLMLLEKSLLLKNSAADIQRLWNLHQALLSFDYDSEDSSEVKDMLLQCFLSVNHIKREEGRRFLSFLFTWNVSFIKMIHGTLRNQLQFFPKSITVHVAELYFRAWTKASGVFLQEIENGCIQDLMHHGVHLHRNSPVHSKVRQILSYFHKQKHRQGVEEMLYRLYQPILWRGLKARNSEVRANAALLFTEAFPVRDPSFDNEVMDSEIQRQFEVLFSLLEDPQPLVRSTGVLGVCRIATKYWDMIPPTILTDFLKKLIDLASDVSSADVRCSVFKCMAMVTENKLSHPLLEQLLPALKNSLHDNSEKVRVAFVDLLQKIKAVRAAKFWKVCPMEHLLARLETDSRPVGRRIVNLLFNSFLPVNQSEEVWCERCVTLIQMNPMAARKFYQYAHEHTAPTNIAKLMLTIRRCLNACIQRTAREDQDDVENSNKENTSVLEHVLSINDTASMASLLEITVILWRSIRKSLEMNKEALAYTTSKFASVLPGYFRVFKEDRCMVPLILLASFMPAAAVPTFSCGVVSKLRSLEKGATENQYSSLIDCLCQWGQVGHVLEVITDWLTEAMPLKQSKRDSERRVRIQEVVEAKPDLALDYAEYIITHTMNRDCLLAVPQKKLNHLLKALGALKEVFYSFISSPETGSCKIDKETALRAFLLYGRLSIHLQHKYNTDERTYLLLLENTAAWTIEKVLPFLINPICEDEASEQKTLVAKQAVEACLTVCKDVIMVGLADPEFQGQILQFSLSVLQAERGYMCLPLLLSVLKEITENCLALTVQNQNEDLLVLLNIAQNVFQKILETAARRLRKQREEALQLLHSAHVMLADFINVVQDWHAANVLVLHGVFSTILAAVLVELSHYLQKVSHAEELTPPETVQDLPPLSSTLLAIIMKSPSLSRSFLGELNESVDSEAVEGVVGLTAVLCILTVVRQGKCKGSDIKSSAASVHIKLQKYYEVVAEASDSIERAIYESALKIGNDILQP
ncbi:condensin-2 complex subunit G2-like [Acipenser ruthenus]|uniref:condensin-2 complex subunit G2-like n=1 Tax=Acipenser ruthenus TaxID=7906 RepID=UPI0027428DF0|nr:condensin-2 complex subunit G2-like [Acipenser ruthenus]